MERITFSNKGAFYFILKNKVEDYFIRTGKRKTGNWNLYIKILVLAPIALLLYVLIIYFIQPSLLSVLLSALLGFVLACIGFNVMHDACHGSYSSKQWVNEMMGYTLNALGGNAFLWKMKHNLHHAYTSVDGLDNDIEKSPLLRQCVSQRWLPMHRYQHFYVLFFYAISSLAWIIVFEFSKYFSGKISGISIKNMNWKEHVIFWLSKILYVVFYIIVPIVLVGSFNWMVGFIALHVSMGFTLAFVFQLGHVVEHTEFLPAYNENKVKCEWAEHQVRSTANFSIENPVMNWFVGGLNYQVEHHLFPNISHIHYHALSKIVKETCEEFDLPYYVNPTMLSALASHFRLMKALGKNR